MNSFSWMKADNLSLIPNVIYGQPFKLLIPKEFGGGYIIDAYQNYGRIGYNSDGSPRYDIYELLAFWNGDMWLDEPYVKVRDVLKYSKNYSEEFPIMKAIDKYTENNRNIGIEIAGYDEGMKNLKFPLKLVSVAYTGSYEDCRNISLNDPNQGRRNINDNTRKNKNKTN